MFYLATGLLLFAGIHLLPTATGLRQGLIGRIGENGYKGLFSLFALSGLILIVFGFSHTDKLPVYHPLPALRPVTIVLMAVSMILFASANMPTNLKRFIRHPMLWGLVCWALAHLLVNGNRADLLLFGGMCIYGLLGMLSANCRGAKLQQYKLPLRKDAMTIAAGLLACGLIIVLHPFLFGVAVF